ncbi:MAG: hypothetical protein H6636_01140 [Anaerolineales bacterium]|nr:hypothetical protein [Anaerolineales bacterium]
MNAELPEYSVNGNTAIINVFSLSANGEKHPHLLWYDGGPQRWLKFFHIIGEIFDKVYTGSPDTFVKMKKLHDVPQALLSTFELSLDEQGHIYFDQLFRSTGKGYRPYLFPA